MEHVELLGRLIRFMESGELPSSEQMRADIEHADRHRGPHYAAALADWVADQ